MFDPNEDREVDEGDWRGVFSGEAAIELVVEEEVEVRLSVCWTKLLRAVMADIVLVATRLASGRSGVYEDVQKEDSCSQGFSRVVVDLLNVTDGFC